MGDSLASSFIEKGLEEWTDSLNSTAYADEPGKGFSRKGIIVGIVTMVILVGGRWVIGLMMYSVRSVMTTIATVESPTVGMRRDSNSGKNGILDDEKAVSRRRNSAIHPQSSVNFISSSFRALARHLHTEAGDLSIFRGIGFAAFFDQVLSVFKYVLYLIVAHFVTQPRGWTGDEKSTYLTYFIACLAILITIRWSVAWTHIVISKPRHVFWFRRLPLSSWTLLKTVGLPRMAASIVPDLVHMASSWAKKRTVPSLDDTPGGEVGWLYIVWRVQIFLLLEMIEPLLQLVFVLPVVTVDNRMQASCLPWKDEPIVPMDRRFGTDPNPNTLVDPKPINFTDAVRSLDRPTFERLAKVYLKTSLLKIIAEGVLALALVTEFAIFWNPAVFWPLVKGSLNIPASDGEKAILESAMAQLFVFNGTLTNSTVT